MRATDGSGELPVPAYELFTGTEALGRMAMERMLAGLSTRHYPVGLEPVGERVEACAWSTSKSAASRKFVRATETALAELLAADLSGLDVVALMVDGVHFAEHCFWSSSERCAMIVRVRGAAIGTGNRRGHDQGPARAQRSRRAQGDRS